MLVETTAVLYLNITLKELRNFILCIIHVGSLFCSVRVYISLHFLPIIFVKLGFVFLCFSFSCFCIFGFQLLVLLYVLNWIFSCFLERLSSILCSGNNNHVLFNFVLTLFKWSIIKACFQSGFELKYLI